MGVKHHHVKIKLPDTFVKKNAQRKIDDFLQFQIPKETTVQFQMDSVMSHDLHIQSVQMCVCVHSQVLAFAIILIVYLIVKYVVSCQAISPRRSWNWHGPTTPPQKKKKHAASSDFYRWHRVSETAPNTCLFSNQRCNVWHQWDAAGRLRWFPVITSNCANT